MDSRLRMIAPHPLGSTGLRKYSAGIFWCCAFAVALQLIFSANVLDQVGLSKAGRIHPSTVILALCTAYAFATGIIPFGRRLRESPALMLYIFGIPALMAYSVYFVGTNGATVFIETFWSAGLLALLLEPASARHKRILGYILLVLVLMNVVVGVFESLTLKEVFPIIYDPTTTQFKEDAGTDEFRAHAFFSHPLTASLVTSMAVFLLYTMRPRFLVAAPVFTALIIGLLAYGGRAALGVVLAVSAGLAFYVLLKGVLQRNLQPSFLLSLGAAVVAMPILAAVLIAHTSIGDRIVYNLYFDGSAQVRATQWAVFAHLNMQDWLFGISKARLEVLKYQIELGARDTDIENFWILLFLDLGAIGFAAFVVVFLSFLYHLARFSGTLNGWLLVASSLAIDSTSNSLGVWTNDLMLEVAFVMAIVGFRDYVPIRMVPQFVRRLPVRRRVLEAQPGLGVVAGPLRSPGLHGMVTPRR